MAIHYSNSFHSTGWMLDAHFIGASETCSREEKIAGARRKDMAWIWWTNPSKQDVGLTYTALKLQWQPSIFHRARPPHCSSWLGLLGIAGCWKEGFVEGGSPGSDAFAALMSSRSLQLDVTTVSTARTRPGAVLATTAASLKGPCFKMA